MLQLHQSLQLANLGYNPIAIQRPGFLMNGQHLATDAALLSQLQQLQAN